MISGGLFVTGTDTGVGKTVVSSLLLAGLASAGIQRRYFKPIQTGTDSDTLEVCRLGSLDSQAVLSPVYFYPEPVAPYRAAILNGQEISCERIQAEWQRHQSPACTVVEGAGGILVPLNGRQFTRDLITLLDVPLIVVSSTRLGTINHTLLTLEAARSLSIKGVVLVGEEDFGLDQTLYELSGFPVVAQVPWCKNVTPEWIQQWGPRIFTPSVLQALWGEG
jgi:dethiobiotin synthase